jgi:cytochrome bd-type quinol oxidase subunit 2
MINKLKRNLLLIAAMFMMATPLAITASASAAADISGNLCSGSNLDLNGDSSDCGNQGDTLNEKIATVINVISVIVGAIAVIMLIFGGFRYVTSGGKQESVASAKNTIMYAIIGLVIVALAQVIVKFVLDKSTG